MIDAPMLDLYAASEPLSAVPGAMPFPDFVAEMMATIYNPQMRSRSTRRLMAHAAAALTELGVSSTADLNIPLIGRLVRPPRSRSLATQCGAFWRTSRPCVCSAGNRPHSRLAVPDTQSLALGQTVAAAAVANEPLDPRGGQGDTSGTRRRRRRTSRRRAMEAASLKALVELVAHTGLRLGEALWLQVIDVDLVSA